MVFYFNYFDDSQSVGRWVSGKWSVGRRICVLWVGGFNKIRSETPFSKNLHHIETEYFRSISEQTLIDVWGERVE